MSAVGTQVADFSMQPLVLLSLPVEEALQIQRYFLFRYGSDDVKRGCVFLP
jgi:hypothetical protein